MMLQQIIWHHWSVKDINIALKFCEVDIPTNFGLEGSKQYYRYIYPDASNQLHILNTVPTLPDNRFLKRMQKIASLVLQGTIDILFSSWW